MAISNIVRRRKRQLSKYQPKIESAEENGSSGS
jgi:hypothetical protein